MPLAVTPPQPAPFHGTSTESFTGIPALLGLPDGVADALRRASQTLSSYSRELDLDLTEISATDYGNLSLTSEENEHLARQVGDACQAILATSALPVFVGKTHSLTPGAIRATLNRYPELSVIQINAHADLAEDHEGDLWHERAAMQRVLDRLPPEKLVSLGTRSGSRSEFQALNQNLTALKSSPIYLSIDLSIFDQAFLPGLHRPVPGGIDLQGFHTLCQTLPWEQIKACDLVGSTGESALAAQILRDLLLRLSQPNTPSSS